MPYDFLEDVATSDVAFEAWGDSLEEMFVSAAEATMNVMVSSLDTISPSEQRRLTVEADSIEMLLFELLQELIFLKDAEQLLLRVGPLEIQRLEERYTLSAEAHGERLDMDKHDLVVDVKAVTMHRFRVERSAQRWECTVVLDI